MLHAQLFEEFGSGPGASSFHVRVTPANCSHRFQIILPLAVQVLGENAIQRGCDVLAATLSVFLQLGHALRFDGYNVHAI